MYIYTTHRNHSSYSKVCCRHSEGSGDTNTIDDEEVALFSRHANEWWNETGEFAALHSLNDLRVPLVRDALLAQKTPSSDDKTLKPMPLAGFNILDVGCGGGILSEVGKVLIQHSS